MFYIIKPLYFENTYKNIQHIFKIQTNFKARKNRLGVISKKIRDKYQI